MRWNQRGMPGSNPDRTGSGQAAAAMTRSRRSRTCAGPAPKRVWALYADLAAAFDKPTMTGARQQGFELIGLDLHLRSWPGATVASWPITRTGLPATSPP